MTNRSRRTTRRWLGAATAAAAAVTIGACDVPDPTGTAPLRYRDAVFTSVTTTSDVQYAEAPLADGTPQKLFADISQPAGDTATKRPVVIWMHGGGFAVGSRKDAMMTELTKRFAQRGYVALSISYRLMAGDLCGGSATPTCVLAAIKAAEDERAAVRYVRAHAAELRIDPDRIAIGGASAGAVTSILMGANPTSTAGSASGNPGFSGAVRAVVSISGGIPTNAPLSAGDPPILFWHGTSDTVVPFAWAKSNADYMRSKGLIGVLHDVQNAGHVPWTQFSQDMDTQARNFLYHALSLKTAGISPPPPIPVV